MTVGLCFMLIGIVFIACGAFRRISGETDGDLPEIEQVPLDEFWAK